MWAQTQTHSQVYAQCFFRLKISTARIEFSWAGSQKELQAWLCYDRVDVLKWKASTPCEGRVIIRLVTSLPIRSRNHSVGPWKFFPTASLYSCWFQSIIPAFAITWETNMCETLEFMKAAVLHNEEILMMRQDLCPQCVHNLTRQTDLSASKCSKELYWKQFCATPYPKQLPRGNSPRSPQYVWDVRSNSHLY